MHRSGEPKSQVLHSVRLKAPLGKGERFHGPEQALSPGFLDGFWETRGPLNIPWVCIVLGAEGGEEHGFHDILKEGLIPETVQNPSADLLVQPYLGTGAPCPQHQSSF